jgi:hypothetical protein
VTRPKYATGKDENHSIPRDFLQWHCGGFSTAPKEARGKTLAYTANYRGYAVMLIDFSAFGGVLTDYYVEVNGHSAWVEVKTEEAYLKPQHDMTQGELWLYHNCKVDFYVIKSNEDFSFLLDELIG